MKKSILYIGNFSFPLGNAAGKRVYSNGKILKELGYEVIFMGMSRDVNRTLSLKMTELEYDGFRYYNLPYPQKNIEWINYKKIFKCVSEFLESEKIIDKLEMVIYYGSPSLSLFNTKLIKFCKEKEIKVISDCVDWLTVKTNNPIFNLVKWSDNIYQKAYANKKVDGVIAISRYLENYYKRSGVKTIVVPPLSPIKYELYQKKSQNDKKVISYAGLPFRKGQQVTELNTLKDRIDKTIVLLHSAKEKGVEFIFNIYGFTKDEYLYAIPSHKNYIDELDENIRFHGITPNDEVVDSIRKSDFTILIRDVNRDTTAGFPTKVSESISCGTPVITTKTSDLEEYIIEGKNGYFINESEYGIEMLSNILSAKNEEINIQKQYCIEHNPFYFKMFIKKLDSYICDIINS